MHFYLNVIICVLLKKNGGCCNNSLFVVLSPNILLIQNIIVHKP